MHMLRGGFAIIARHLVIYKCCILEGSVTISTEFSCSNKSSKNYVMTSTSGGLVVSIKASQFLATTAFS